MSVFTRVIGYVIVCTYFCFLLYFKDQHVPLVPTSR